MLIIWHFKYTAIDSLFLTNAISPSTVWRRQRQYLLHIKHY